MGISNYKEYYWWNVPKLSFSICSIINPLAFILCSIRPNLDSITMSELILPLPLVNSSIIKQKFFLKFQSFFITFYSVNIFLFKWFSLFISPVVGLNLYYLVLIFVQIFLTENSWIELSLLGLCCPESLSFLPYSGLQSYP